MATPHIQTGFHSGEWSPSLNARVDLQKYHSAAALIRNFFVDYRGGASSRTGTKYVLQALVSASKVRLIPFQASSTVSYVLEFGQLYLRFHTNGAPVLEAATTISGATQANPGVITDNAHGYSTGDWIYISNVVGMTQLNGNYYIVVKIGANSYSLTNLTGTAVDTTTFTAYVSGGTAQRVYTLTTPYQASDLALLKFVQNVTSLIITHGSYAPAALTIVAAANWTLTNITFGPTIPAPTGVGAATNLGAGVFNYSYVVTAVDINGQESVQSTPATLANFLSLTSNNGTNTISWTAVPGAASYNVYKAAPTITVAVVSGAFFGFIGNTFAVSFTDSTPGITPDFAQTPTIAASPSTGGVVLTIALGVNDNYTTVPTPTIGAPPAGGYRATAYASLKVSALGAITHAASNADIGVTTGAPSPAGSTITLPNGVVINIVTVTLAGVIGGITFYQVTTISLVNAGSITSGTVPANPVAPISCSAANFAGFNGAGGAFGIALTWTIGSLNLIQGGFGYTSAPAVTFSSGAATATTTISPVAGGGTPGVLSFPSCCGFYQQRLVLAAPNNAQQTFFMSIPDAPYNFNYSIPAQADDAITGAIVSRELNTIRSLTTVPTGLIAFTSKAAWLINGGGGLTPITPADATANSQAFCGASDLPPISINFDVLFVQAKGSFVRDLSFNFYTQIFTGTDISILSSHLFFGYTLNEWAWVEEPYKTIQAIRNDGNLLTCTYIKEQEILGWSHSDTLGQFQSVCTVTELISAGFSGESSPSMSVDATYVVVQRVVNGNTVQYIERFAERIFPYGVEDAWCVDAGLQSTPALTGTGTLTASQSATGTGVTFTSTANDFSTAQVGWVIRMGGGIATITSIAGAPTSVTATITQAISYITPNSPTNAPFPAVPGNWTLWQPFTIFSGLAHLRGQNVYGLADGVVVGPLQVSNGIVAYGSVTLPNAATKVTLGLSFTAQLQTLRLDLGEPTVQGEYKKITAVTVRCRDTLGLSIGKTFSSLVPMKDLVVGNVGTMSNAIVTNLVTDDARTIIDPSWDVPGQYCIQQSQPLPASILGVIPEIVQVKR